jgi:hypothetical protein
MEVISGIIHGNGGRERNTPQSFILTRRFWRNRMSPRATSRTVALTDGPFDLVEDSGSAERDAATKNIATAASSNPSTAVMLAFFLKLKTVT